MEELDQIKQLLQTPKDIAIFSHRNPDGDAIGSSLAMYHFLSKLGHNVYVILPSEYPPVFEFLKDAGKIIIYDLEPQRAVEVINKTGFHIFLDFNSLDRIDKMGEIIHFKEVHKLMIDHHLDPEPIADFIISDPEQCSTCIMVYDFISNLGYRHLIDKDLATCIYAGILTDTASFKYNMTADVFVKCADLLTRGIDNVMVQREIFDSYTEKQVKLIGHCINNRMELLPDYDAGIIWLSKEDYADFDIKRGDTEGIVNYLLKIKSVRIAAFITEQPTIVKISLRSKGDFSVEEICRDNFNGGGHLNAAGGYAYAPLESVINRFKSVLPKYFTKHFKRTNPILN